MIGNAVSHYLKVLMGREEPLTQTSVDERQSLAKYATGAGLAVEIGVFEGVNTALIAGVLEKEGVLYGIDPFFKGRLGICYSKLVTKLQLKKTGTAAKVRLIEKLSFDAAGDVPENIDFLFIDGDHSLEGIRKDWELFSRKLRPGGIAALHDTTMTEKNSYISGLGSLTYYKDVIANDPRFTWLETVDSLNVLQRKS
jgi:predicted O-methyltransferase YrrM